MKKPYFNSENGSIAVLVALLIPVMLLLIVLVLDIGQIIFEKIRLQNTVDACALVAADIQAIGLNEIADLNRELVEEHKKLKRILRSGIWYSRGEASQACRFYKRVSDAIIGYQDRANTDYAQKAREFAERVKTMNLPGSSLHWKGRNGKLTGLDKIKKNITYRYYRISCSSNPMSSNYCPPTSVLFWSDPDDPGIIGDHDGSEQRLRRRTFIMPGFYNQVERRVKYPNQNPANVTFASLEINQPAKPFILGSKRFGYLPGLTARAEAKPAGGNIKNYQPRYKPVMVK